MPLRRWIFVVASIALLAIGFHFEPVVYYWWTLPTPAKMVAPITSDNAIGKALHQAYAAEKSKDYQQAVDVLTTYLDQEHGRGWYTVFALRQRSLEYENLKQYDRAEADLTAAVKVPGLATVAYGYRGEFYMRRRRDKEALADYRAGAKLAPYDGDFPYKEGELYVARGEYQRALERFSEAIRLDPKKRKYYLDRGSAYNFASMYREALADFDRALSIDDPKASPREIAYPKLGRGFAALQLGDYRQAIEDFDAVLKVVPRASNAFAWRGSAHQMLGEREPAITDFKAALAIDSQYKQVAEKLKKLEPQPQ